MNAILLFLIQKDYTYKVENDSFFEASNLLIIFYILSIILFYAGIIYLYILLVKYLKLKIKKIRKDL